MTNNQRATVNQLVADGFKVVTASVEVVRVTKGADRRIVFPDGSQKRANHVEHKERRA
ncbi:MAG: hypothetical protein KKC55_16595 [Gammaproteobacteria bacterium]|jgi:hypothetical protein|uniref:Uncharacterized protein n=1 Tax=viral metagenome TaxID=1070528 RepID=A0A6M3MC12_9ZZZZ|nr:hypothetical protein [Gammaproteobacteria bacterium]